MKERLEQLYEKVMKKKAKIQRLGKENEFYHQIVTIFLTLKKVIETENKYCYMLATETDVLKKR